MTPFYGIDRTVTKKNIFHEGDCFIARSTSTATGAAMERAAKQAAVQLGRAKLPAPLDWLRIGTGWGTALLFIGIIRALGTVTVLEAYENAPGLFWALGGCAVVWLVLTAIGRVIRKNVESTEEYATAVRRAADGVDTALRELGVPGNAKDVDIISIRFKWKNGKMKPVACGMETSERTNESFKVFLREDKLCLANAEHRYEIPLKELRCLRSIKKHLYSQGWNKSEDFDQGFYKPYKLTMDSYRRIHMKRYGILELEHQGKSWAIWLPPYELNYISALTGLPVIEEKKK